jgi:hypothetical protein
MSEKLVREEPWIDPIVAEVRAAREALLADAGYDLHTLCELLRARQAAAGRQVVHRQPRRVARTSEEAA